MVPGLLEGQDGARSARPVHPLPLPPGRTRSAGGNLSPAPGVVGHGLAFDHQPNLNVKKLLGAAVLAAIALFMLLGSLTADVGGGAAAVVALLLVVGLPAAGAALLVRSHFAERSRRTGRKAQLRQHTLDAEILRLAGERGGRLTVVEVATELGVPLEGAKQALDGLLLREHADLELTDAGVTVYHFYDVRHLGDKHTARGILDA